MHCNKYLLKNFEALEFAVFHQKFSPWINNNQFCFALAHGSDMFLSGFANSRNYQSIYKTMSNLAIARQLDDSHIIQEQKQSLFEFTEYSEEP